MKTGKYIVFEGMDGTGKSTAIKKVTEWLSQTVQGKEVVFTKEAGGTPIGKKIREIILYNTASKPLTDILLFLADRCENKHRIVIPNVDKGNIVLCDRGFYSSLVYQGYMNDNFDEVYELHLKCNLNYEPDILFIFDTDPKISMSRISKGDKFEIQDIEYFKKIRKHYKEDIPKLVSRHCKIKFIDATLPENEVFEKLKEILKKELSL